MKSREKTDTHNAVKASFEFIRVFENIGTNQLGFRTQFSYLCLGF